MRAVVGVFGCLCGLIVVALVARYGFKTADNEIDGAISAFLFGVIAAGGLGGHAVAIRLWRRNRSWAVVVTGLIGGKLGMYVSSASATMRVNCRASLVDARYSAVIETNACACA